MTDEQDLLELDAQLDRAAELRRRDALTDETLTERLASLSEMEWPPRSTAERIIAGVWAQLHDASATDREAEVADSKSRGHKHSRSVIRQLAVGALVAAAAAALILFLLPAGSNQGGGGDLAAAPWRLAGYISQALWQQNVSGPTTGLLNCPVANRCYMVDGAPVPNPIGHGPSPLFNLLVSTDHGRTWSALALPSSLSFTTGLVCPGSTGDDCYAGGQQGADPVLLVTADGGIHWQALPLPAGAGHLALLQCPTQSHCVGALTSSSDPLSQQGRPYVTNDGGVNWSPVNDGGVELQLLNCSDSTCVASGLITSGPQTVVMNLYSHDGGLTWNFAAVPPGFGFLDGFTQSMVCADAEQCWGVGAVVVSPTSVSAGRPVVVRSTDGGASWQLVSGLGDITPSAVACVGPTTCWIAGGAGNAVSQPNPITITAGETVSHGDPAVVVTRDGGLTWSETVISTPQAIPPGTSDSSLISIGQISCPTTSVCVAVGSGDITALHTAIYTDAGDGG